MKTLIHTLLFTALLTIAAFAKPIHLAPDLEVEQLSDHVYLHRSWLQTHDFGKVACNGLVFVSDGEALVIDTPVNDAMSESLIHWIQKSLNAKVKGVVVGHFHADCLGGLSAFEKAGATTYSNRLTQDIAQKKGLPIPRVGFEKALTIKIGDQVAQCGYFGGGHTIDNIVTYLPAEKTLFGGCLIKAEGAGKGNLEDADVAAWSHTVKKVGDAYPGAKTIVPGHGDSGGRALLRYTSEMFQGDAK